MSILWTPPEIRSRNSEIAKFSKRYRPQINYDDYFSLHEWSIEHGNDFWAAVWDFTNVVGIKGESPFVSDIDDFKQATWFPDARINFAENMLKRRDNHPALVSILEDGSRTVLSYKHLYLQVAQLASSLRKEGVVAGDRVAGYVPNTIESAVAMLATVSLGAIWTSCSPDFGEQSLIDRFGQTKPKVLFTTDAYLYNGKTHSLIKRLARIVPKLPSIERVVISQSASVSDFTIVPQAIGYADYLDSDASQCDFQRFGFDHPLYILYSSGTTGKPKCIVHRAGGVLLEHRKAHVLQTDIRADDVFFYFSTCGWMMWNWHISALAIGCTLVLYDGSPTYPKIDRLFELIDQELITVFGGSAKYLSTVNKAGFRPVDEYSLTSLKTMLSTGSVLSEEGFEYVYDAIKSDIWLSSIAGGTDLVGAFLCGAVTLPVHSGEMQCSALGFAMDTVVDQHPTQVGEQGELVCNRPFPTVPIEFWGDNGDQFHAAYFKQNSGIWTHGDYAAKQTSGGWVIYGRSDALLNPGGVRIGTAEIYRQVDKIKCVADSVAVGYQVGDDCEVILFVQLHKHIKLKPELVSLIKVTIREGASPRHVPSRVIQIADIPRTLSGKIAELAVRDVIHGREVTNREALTNPESLTLFEGVVS